MNDGFTILNLPVVIEELLKNKHLTWGMSNVSIDGIELDKPQEAELNNLKLKIDKGRASLRGSFHKYYNSGKHNSDDFHVCRMPDVIQDICQKLEFNPDNAELNGLEFGVNIKTGFNPNEFIDSLVVYKGEPFVPIRVNGKGYGRECILDNYIVKIYNKSLQYGLPYHVLRIEIKVRKMRYFKDNAIMIKRLSDLENFEIYPQLSDLLSTTFEDILVYDNRVNIVNLSDKERLILSMYSNPNTWTERRKNKYTGAQKKAFQREFNIFKNLSEKIGTTGHKNEVANLIKLKCSDLINVALSPLLNNELSSQNVALSPLLECRTFTTFEIDENTNVGLSPLIKSETETMPRNTVFEDSQVEVKEPALISTVNFMIRKGKFHPSWWGSLSKPQQRRIEKIRVQLRELIDLHFAGYNGPVCEITGAPIDGQKKDCKFLSPKGVEQYYKNFPDIYSILTQFLDKSKHKESPIDGNGQNNPFYQIAKQIRHYSSNKNTNQKNNNLRVVKRIDSHPVFFPTIDLISPEKKRIMGLS